MRLIFTFVFSLILFSISFAEAIYKVYYSFIPVGKIIFKWEKDNIEVKGSVYPYLKFLYDYNFVFESRGNDFSLIEREGGKLKVYKKEDIYRKKPWLPLVVKFLKTRKADENGKFYPYKLEVEDKKYIIYPLKSKKVKRIEIIFDGNIKFPKEIRIYGNHYIKLVREKP